MGRTGPVMIVNADRWTRWPVDALVAHLQRVSREAVVLTAHEQGRRVQGAAEAVSATLLTLPLSDVEATLASLDARLPGSAALAARVALESDVTARVEAIRSAKDQTTQAELMREAAIDYRIATARPGDQSPRTAALLTAAGRSHIPVLNPLRAIVLDAEASSVMQVLLTAPAQTVPEILTTLELSYPGAAAKAARLALESDVKARVEAIRSAKDQTTQAELTIRMVADYRLAAGPQTNASPRIRWLLRILSGPDREAVKDVVRSISNSFVPDGQLRPRERRVPGVARSSVPVEALHIAISLGPPAVAGAIAQKLLDTTIAAIKRWMAADRDVTGSQDVKVTIFGPNGTDVLAEVTRRYVDDRAQVIKSAEGPLSDKGFARRQRWRRRRR